MAVDWSQFTPVNSDGSVDWSHFTPITPPTSDLSSQQQIYNQQNYQPVVNSPVDVNWYANHPEATQGEVPIAPPAIVDQTLAAQMAPPDDEQSILDTNIQGLKVTALSAKQKILDDLNTMVNQGTLRVNNQGPISKLINLLPDSAKDAISNARDSNLDDLSDALDVQSKNQAAQQAKLASGETSTPAYYGKQFLGSIAPLAAGLGAAAIDPASAPIVLPALFGAQGYMDQYGQARIAGDDEDTAHERAATAGGINALAAGAVGGGIASDLSPLLKGMFVAGTNEAVGTLSAPLQMAADDAITGNKRDAGDYLDAAITAAKQNVLPSLAFGGLGAIEGTPVDQAASSKQKSSDLADQVIRSQAASGDPAAQGAVAGDAILKQAGVSADDTAVAQAVQTAQQTAQELTPEPSAPETPAQVPSTPVSSVEDFSNGKKVLFRGDVETIQNMLEQADVPPGMVKIENGDPVGIYFPSSYKDRVSNALNYTEVSDENAPVDTQGAQNAISPLPRTEVPQPALEATQDNGNAEGVREPGRSSGGDENGQSIQPTINGVQRNATDVNAPVDFTPEERNKATAESLINSIPDLSPTQQEAIRQSFPGVVTDPVTGYYKPEELAPTLAAAQASGEPSSYAEIDLRKLGGLNAATGSVSLANEHFNTIANIIRQTAQASDADVVPIRKGEDELGIVFKGIDADQAHEVMLDAKAKVDNYVKSQGLDTIVNPKGGDIGTGIHFGVSDITSGPLSDTLRNADSLVELRKKGDEYTRPSETPGAGQDAEGTVNPGATENTAAIAAETQPSEKTNPQNQVIGVKKSSVAESRVGREVGDLLSNSSKSFEELWDKAQDTASTDPDAGKRLTQELLNNPRPVSNEEVALLLHDRVHLSNDLESAKSAYDNAQTQNEKTTALIRVKEAERQIDANDHVVDPASSTAGAALSAFRMVARNDYSLANVMRRTKMAMGVDSMDKIPDSIKDQISKLQEIIKNQDDIISKSENNRTVTPKKTPDERMQSRIKDQLAKLEAKIKDRLTACPV